MVTYDLMCVYMGVCVCIYIYIQIEFIDICYIMLWACLFLMSDIISL